MATSLIEPLEMARGSALETGALADSGDVRHVSKSDGINAVSVSNVTRQLAHRDNMLRDKVNEIVSTVNNREQIITMPVGSTSLPAGASETVESFRIPQGFEARVLDAVVASSPSNGARIEVLHSAGTFGSSSGTQVILTADEFSGGSDFWPYGEFIVRIYNEGAVSSSVTGCLILTMRPVGPSSGGLIGPGAIGPQGPPGVTGLPGTQGPQGLRGSTGLGLTWRGTWDVNTAYALNDVVSFTTNGAVASYIARTNSTARQPPSPTGAASQYWALLAYGPQGPQGTQGPQGDAGVVPNEQHDTVNVANGAATVDVTFPVAFNAPPQPPQCSVVKPDANSDNIFVTNVYNVTAQGFTAQLSAAASVGGYKLGYRVAG